MAKKRFKMGRNAWQLVGLAMLALLTLGVVGYSLFVPATAAPAQAGAASYKPAPATASAPPPVPLVAFIGDSYSAGSGSPDPLQRWTTLTSQKMGWVERNFAVPGTGYVNEGKPGTCGKPACPRYAGVVSEVVKAGPSIVVISGGRNDVWYAPDDVRASVADLVAQIHRGLPHAKLVITSPLWDARPAPATMQSVIAAVKGAAEASGTPYAELGEPLAGHPDLIFTDGVHPNVAGHAAISDAAAKAITAALKP